MNKPFQEWLNAAQDDLRLLEKIIDDENLTHIAAFHSQQSIEKSLKALLEFHEQDILKIHSLNKLFKLCEKDIPVTNFDIVNTLDSIYIESRYPGVSGYLPYGKPSCEEGKRFYEFALAVYNNVKTIVSKKE